MKKLRIFSMAIAAVLCISSLVPASADAVRNIPVHDEVISDYFSDSFVFSTWFNPYNPNNTDYSAPFGGRKDALVFSPDGRGEYISEHYAQSVINLRPDTSLPVSILGKYNITETSRLKCTLSIADSEKRSKAYEELSSLDCVSSITEQYHLDKNYTWKIRNIIVDNTLLSAEEIISAYPALKLRIDEGLEFEASPDGTYAYAFISDEICEQVSEEVLKDMKALSESGIYYYLDAYVLNSSEGESYYSVDYDMYTAAPDKSRNWEYYSSLSDDEVFEEYKAYREQIGVPVQETTVKDGIIRGLVEDTNAQLAYGWIDPYRFSMTIPAFAGGAYVNELPASGSYYGFDNIDSGISYVKNNVGLCGVYIHDENAGDSTAYDIMRREMTIYNSEFFAEYGKDSDITWGYLDGGREAVQGDANADGKLTLADSVAVLQFIANKDKYPLTSFGAGAADIYGKGDGITALDALEIQKIEANK